MINGSLVHISEQVAYANCHNVLATPSGNNPHIHPSEPNYLWAEAGTNFNVSNDNDPFSSSGATNRTTTRHLSAFFDGGGKNMEVVSGRHRFGFKWWAAHQCTSPSRTVDRSSDQPRGRFCQRRLQCLSMHTAVQINSTTPPSTILWCWDAAKIRQGDDFLSQIVPMIMASEAYKNQGVLWWDESEFDGVAGDNGDSFDHTIGEMVISKRAHRNVGGFPYPSPINFTHSSDRRTMQLLFHVGPFLGDAANATDLSDLFQPGAIPRVLIPVP